MCGYFLSGDTSLALVFFLYGPGRNGKSVFVDTIRNIMGDYAKSVTTGLLLDTKNDNTWHELAGLQGIRFVSASETDEGRPWAEARLKRLSAGDMVTARFLRQEFFEYKPQFKFLIQGNHRPIITNLDDAMKARMRILPFEHRPTAMQIRFEDVLKEEWPQILNWMIRGYALVQELGRPPACFEVDSATEEYFEEQATLEQWIAEALEPSPGTFETTTSLYASWVKFCKASGEFAGSLKSFVGKLKRHKEFTKKRDIAGRMGFIGFTVRPMNVPIPDHTLN
jgi:putative DNA primase/helicase